jgi:hypothetical protein
MKIETTAQELVLHNKETGEDIDVAFVCYSYNEKLGRFHVDVNERPDNQSDYKPVFSLLKPNMFTWRFWEGYVTALEDGFTVKNKPSTMDAGELMTETILGWEEGMIMMHF